MNKTFYIYKFEKEKSVFITDKEKDKLKENLLLSSKNDLEIKMRLLGLSEYKIFNMTKKEWN